jgi:hypothetical protein
LHEIMCTYAAKKSEKHEQLVSTAIFDASYLCLVQNQCRRIYISQFYLANILMGIIRSNYVTFYEITCSYEAKMLKNITFLNSIFQRIFIYVLRKNSSVKYLFSSAN